MLTAMAKDCSKLPFGRNGSDTVDCLKASIRGRGMTQLPLPRRGPQFRDELPIPATASCQETQTGSKICGFALHAIGPAAVGMGAHHAQGWSLTVIGADFDTLFQRWSVDRSGRAAAKALPRPRSDHCIRHGTFYVG